VKARREKLERKSSKGDVYYACLLGEWFQQPYCKAELWGGGRNWRCPAVPTQMLSALGRSAGRKVRVKQPGAERALPHHSLHAVMVVKAGIAAAVLDHELLKCLQFVHPTAATK